MKAPVIIFSFNYKRAIWILAYLLASNFLFSQSQQVYLFGNLADVGDKAAFYQKLEELFQNEQEPFTLVVNGDLVNEKISGSGQEEQMKPLFQLVDLVAKFENGQLIMVPGDREWNSGKKGGEKSLKNIEERFIEYYKKKATAVYTGQWKKDVRDRRFMKSENRWPSLSSIPSGGTTLLTNPGQRMLFAKDFQKKTSKKNWRMHWITTRIGMF